MKDCTNTEVFMKCPNCRFNPYPGYALDQYTGRKDWDTWDWLCGWCEGAARVRRQLVFPFYHRVSNALRHGPQ